MRFFTLLLTLASTFAAASSPRLAITKADVCLLGDNQELRCWSRSGQARRVAPHSGVLDVAGSKEVFCSVDRSPGVHCHLEGESQPGWLLQSATNLELQFQDLQQPRKIVGSETNAFCVWDARQGMRCALAWSTPKFAAIPGVDREPLEMAVDSGVACAILADHRLQCWGPFENLEQDTREPLLTTPPTALVEPHDLVMYKGKACVIDEGQAKCWGNRNGWSPNLSLPKTMYPTQLGFTCDDGEYQTEIYFAANWLDAGDIYSAQAQTYISQRWHPQLEEALFLRTRDQSECVANATEIQCLVAAFKHGLPVHYQPVGELTALLRKASAAAYRDRRAVYTAALTRMQGLSDAGQAFVFRSLAPLLRGTDSTAFREQLLPFYEKYLVYWAPRSDSPDNVESALWLLVALIPEGHPDRWEPLKTALGAALAEHGSPASLASLKKAAGQLQPVLKETSADAHLAPSMTAIQELLNGLP